MRSVGEGMTGTLVFERVSRLGLALAIGLALACAIFLVDELLVLPHQGDWGMDLWGYRAAMDRLLATGSPYSTMQMAPYPLASAYTTSVWLYPPTAIALMLPFRFLPPVAWWLVPAGIVAWSLASWRPAAWTYPLIGLCLVWPGSAAAILYGNADIWIAAFVAVGLRWGWPAALVLVKPSFAPLVLLGIGKPRAWLAGLAGFALLSFFCLPLWAQYIAAMRNLAGLSWTYSVASLPLALVPLIAWLGRQASRSSASSTLTTSLRPSASALR